MNTTYNFIATEQKKILEIKQIVPYIERKYAINLYHLSPKKVFFVSHGNDFCLCSPSSKFHTTTQCYWVDITLKQKLLLESYKHALLVFRLENEKIWAIKWDNLKPFLNAHAMQYNTHELEHWKLYIYSNHIRIGKSNQRIKGKIQSLLEWEKEYIL